MRILFLCQYYYPEKVPGHQIAEAFVKEGHQVTVVCQTPNYGFKNTLPGYENGKEEVLHGVKIIRLKTRARKKGLFSLMRNYLSFYFAVNRWARTKASSFDVIYAWSLSPVLYLSAGKIIKKRQKIPFYIHVLDCWPASVFYVLKKKEKGLFHYLLKKVSASYYKSADHIFVSSPSFSSYLKNVCGKKCPPISFLPQPYEEEECKPYSLSTKKHSFLYAGNIGKLQLVVNLIEAVSYCKNEDLDFHIFGNGSAFEECKKKVQELGLEQQVIFHDYVSFGELKNIAKQMTGVFVSLESQGESVVSQTIPLKCINSLTFGIPIIGILKGDGKKVLEEAKGCVFSSSLPKEIAAKMKFLCSLSFKERHEMGKNNQNYAQENFSLTHFMKNLQIYLLK